ncbi:hypothetical protein L0B53_04145 [Vibrio sp. SS-MA-C1-2]|uniref:hypothetical protein n=1 Tax=Vibrio sp. SS-MA-C1-2 TaxID=2908646 RepID=UPI001F214657|nr:hypothetical protein [Vibrio sp. SS-MA-C1-2]UJF17114.1 hypothetical protein L0B53_04145 [Vibrio sp. SS-MA-C1-2]
MNKILLVFAVTLFIAGCSTPESERNDDAAAQTQAHDEYKQQEMNRCMLLGDANCSTGKM